jgi:competence protein ComGC
MIIAVLGVATLMIIYLSKTIDKEYEQINPTETEEQKNLIQTQIQLLEKNQSLPVEHISSIIQPVKIKKIKEKNTIPQMKKHLKETKKKKQQL